MNIIATQKPKIEKAVKKCAVSPFKLINRTQTDSWCKKLNCHKKIVNLIRTLFNAVIKWQVICAFLLDAVVN